jgi:hypothetical protein
MAKKKVAKVDKLWEELGHRIKVYAFAAIAEAEKGGGDPADYEVLELRLQLAQTELNAHIIKMRREYDL